MPEVAHATITVTPVLEGAQQSITEQMTQAATSSGKEAGEAAGKSMGESIGSGMSSVGGALTKGVTAPLTAIGTAAVASWKEVDTGLDTIVKKTGASGDALDDMRDILNNITKNIPTDFATAGAAIGEVNTRFGSTGTELEALSTQFVKFAKLNDTDVSNSVDSVSKMLASFGMGAEDAGKMLDALNVVGQQTGVDVGTLSETVAANAKQFQEMGLSAEDAASFIGATSMAGLDSSTAMMGMKTAMKKATDEGKSLDDVLGEFETTMGSNADESDKLAAAYELFGTRAGAAIENAVSNGSLSLSDFSSSLGDFEGSVDDTFAGTVGPMDEFQTTLNELKTAGAELVEAAGPALSDFLSGVSTGIETLTDKWNSLSPEMQDTIIKVAGIAAVAGPLLVIGGAVIGGISKIAGGLGGLIGSIGGIGGAAGAAGPSLETAAGGFVNAAAGALKMIGAAAALWIAAKAIQALVDAAIKITEAGTPAIAVLAGMAIGIGVLMGVAAALGPALTAGAIGIGVFGAAMFGIGAGIDLACTGIAKVVEAIGGLVEVIATNAPGINSVVSGIGETVGGVITTITDGIANVITAISDGISGVLDSVAGIFEKMGQAALDAGTGFEKLATAVTNLTNNTSVFDLGSTLGAVATGVKDINKAAEGSDASATKVDTLTTAFVNLTKEAGNTTKAFQTMTTNTKSAMTTIATCMRTTDLAGSMKTALDGASRALASGLSSLQAQFSRTKFSFKQHIDVPHFSMSGKFDAKTGSVPTVAQPRWYARAAEYGAIFDTPTIIGVGDAAQPELLIGEEKLKEILGGGKTTTNTFNIYGAENPMAVADAVVSRLNLRARTV